MAPLAPEATARPRGITTTRGHTAATETELEETNAALEERAYAAGAAAVDGR